MNINCHLCTKPLHDQPQRGAFSCDFCGTKHKKGEFRLRCDNPKCDFDLDQSCAQRFAGFNSTFSSQKSQCNKCKYPLINATYTKNTNWSCDKCKGKFNKYSQLRLRCEAHDYDLCGGCNAQLQSTFSAPPQQQGFNAPPQQQQGFNAPPQQQQGFNAPPQQQQGFNAPPQQQQGFNAPPQQPVNPLNNQTHHKNTKPIIACHKCVSVKLEDASNRSTAWSCDFCGNKHKKGDYRLRCNKHDFDVCLNCTQRFSDFDQSFDSWKHACKTCKHPLVNATYSKNTKWSCDQCKSKYDKYTQLRLRCEKHDYDLCGNCCKTMQHQFNQPGAIIQLNTQFGQVTITSSNNQPQQQQGFNAPPQQQQGFNAPPQQQQGFNAPPQQQQGFNAPPQQQQQQGFEQVFIGGALHQEQVIRSGQFMSSPSNQYHLFMQHDGNLVLYSDKSFQPQYIVWSTNTANKGQAPHLLKLQGDGNLVIYDRTNTTTWASNTYNVGAMPYKLCIQEDRNICLYDRNNQVTFQTNTTLQQQGFNAPPQQQQGFNAPPQQQQGFNAPPQQQNPQLVQLEKDQAALNQKKQKLEQEQAKLQRELQALETQNNAENQKLQVELQQLPQKQQVEQQQLKAKQDAEMQQLIAKQEQERQKLSATQQQNYTKLNTTQTQEKTKLEQSHQKIHQQQQIKVSKISTEQQKVQQQLHGIQTEQSVLDQRRKMIPQQQGFNQPPISFQ